MRYANRVDDLLNERGKNYILPFLWMHGESHEALKEEIEAIKKCGIKEICIESRPHPDFVGEHWWRDMDMVMEEAQKNNMRIWVLDDDKFPTGHANGAFKNKYPDHAKVYLAERHMDIVGPCSDSAVLIEPFLGSDGELIAVLACPKPDTQELDISGNNILDLTSKVHDGIVYFDIPEGFYRLFVLFKTRKNGGREYYMNLIDTQSVRVLIDEVYEPHFQHYGKYFGETFAGFFSDEPECGNTPGYDFTDRLGKRDVKLPWSNELEELLKEVWQEDFIYNLPALWYEMGEKTRSIRYGYMDAVTTLIDRCFTRQIGKWCREHKVEYIGHIIEDDNAHVRLGCSIGHFFRAQKAQDMSGIDVVLLQIMPGFTETIHQWIASDRDGEFFHYGLAKLGSSLAHIDPSKKGRALCEIYGAYGWGEGVGLMKWLTDHMLVRGINTFVPHAFSPLYPDRDCPPHFYARGNNPQYRFFVALMKYMNRLSHLVSEGKYRVDTAVLYHAESEWSGGKTMLFQKPVRKLLEEQLDCDVIPVDILASDEVKINQDGELIINQISYRSLIIPYCEYLSEKCEEFVIKAVSQGFKVYIIDEVPKATSVGTPIKKEFIKSVEVITLDQIATVIKTNQDSYLTLEKKYKDLRFSCYEHIDSKVLMFFNESLCESVNTRVSLNEEDIYEMIRYDGITNTVSDVYTLQNSWKLKLAPGESAVYIINKINDQKKCIDQVEKVDSMEVVSNWEISLASPQDYPVFEKK